MTLQIQNKTRHGSTGTASAIVCFADKPEEAYLLSVSHVMAATRDAAIGDAIVAVTGTGSLAAGAVIGTLWDWTGLTDGAGFPNLADAAIAKLSAGIVPETAFPELVQLRFARTRPSAGERLTSMSPSGAGGPVRNPSEDRVIAWSDAASPSAVWDYGMADHIIGGFAVADGDSGAPVLNGRREVVGIISGIPVTTTGDSGPSTVISPIDNILGHAQWNPRSLVAYAERHAPPVAEIPVPRTPEEFIVAHRDDALQMQQKFGIPASVCLAQSALETGWGRHVVANCYFGIKGTGGSGNTATFQTHEVVDGISVPQLATFRAYSSFAEAAEDYGKLLTTSSRYSSALQHRTDPEAFVTAIAEAGYATAPNYAELVIGVLRSHGLIGIG